MLYNALTDAALMKGLFYFFTAIVHTSYTVRAKPGLTSGKRLMFTNIAMFYYTEVPVYVPRLVRPRGLQLPSHNKT